MDTLTHALSGALIARIAAPKGDQVVKTRDCVLLGTLAAAFPDSDVVLSALSPLAYLYHHRGVTHSLLMLPLWALLLAWGWSRLRRNHAGFPVYALIAGLGVGVHILGDLITSFGTMIFAPLSDRRVQWGTTFIIDLWFSGIILAGLLASLLLRQSRLPAFVGAVVLCGYIGLQWMQRERAVEIGAAYARAQGIGAQSVSALPRPVSPFNWMIIVSEQDRYHYAFVNLLRTHIPEADANAGLIRQLDAQYWPADQLRWQGVAKFAEGEDETLARLAWQHEAFGFFRWFAAYPLVAEIERSNPLVCVWFRDLRFLTPGRDAWPFRYGMCRDDQGVWRAFDYPQGERPLRITAE